MTEPDNIDGLSFSAECRLRMAVGWQAYQDHPWLVDLEQGRLTVERFLSFQIDDAPFIPYIHRTLALGVVQAASGSDWARAATSLMAEYFVAEETGFKRDLIADLGGPPARFDAGALTPAREAYANHLLTVGLDGSIGEIAAALYPCAMFTQVVGERFRNVDVQGPEPFRAWTQYYANKAGAAIAQAHARMMDSAATTAEARERMLFAYGRSLQHQIRVFDAAYAGHPGWPPTGWDGLDVGAPAEAVR